MAKGSSPKFKAGKTSAVQNLAKDVLKRVDYLSWKPYNLLVALVLIINGIAVILNGMSCIAYSMVGETDSPLFTSQIVGLVFGLFAFLWALVVFILIAKRKSPGFLTKLVALTAVVSLVAALAAGWFVPSAEIVEAFPGIFAYKGAAVALYSVQIVLYLILARMLV